MGIVKLELTGFGGKGLSVLALASLGLACLPVNKGGPPAEGCRRITQMTSKLLFFLRAVGRHLKVSHLKLLAGSSLMV